MPVVVKIKAGKYGSAIGLLLERGGAFQTRHERTLIVNSEQKKVLEEAKLVETNGSKEETGEDDGHKKGRRVQSGNQPQPAVPTGSPDNPGRSAPSP